MKIFTAFFLIIFSLNNISGETPEKIIKEIDDLISEIPAGTKMAIMIYNPLNQDTIFSVNHTESMIPASNTKLFTTVTALELMGGDHLLSTQILADDVNLSDSTINGNIYIKGFGNPTFTTEDLEELINQLYQSGLRRVTGNVVGDDKYFDNVYSRDDWISEERANVKLPPISALVIDRNRTIITKKRKGRYRNYYVNVENPPLFAAKKFQGKVNSLWRGSRRQINFRADC